MRVAKMAGRGSAEDLLPAERRAIEKFGHLPLNFRAMAAVSNLFRASRAVRRHIEASVLGPDRLSWTSFVALWVLWVCGSMEVRELAATVGMSRPTASCVVATLRRRACVRSRRGLKDGRTVFVVLTPKGRRTVKRLMPTFNAEEVAVTASLAPRELEILASMLRSIVRGVQESDPSLSVTLRV
jgi:DNA-binding MarR family transcriptional regulator